MLFPQNSFLPFPYATQIAYSLQLLCTLGLQRLGFSLLQVKNELSPKNAGNASFLLLTFALFLFVLWKQKICMTVTEPNLWRTSLRCAGMGCKGACFWQCSIDQVLQLHILELTPGLVRFPYPSLTLWHGWHEEHLPISL